MDSTSPFTLLLAQTVHKNLITKFPVLQVVSFNLFIYEMGSETYVTAINKHNIIILFVYTSSTEKTILRDHCFEVQ